MRGPTPVDVSRYFPDMLFHGHQGHLGPADVRFDPLDAAHLSVDRSGTARFRLFSEHGFAAAHLVRHDGTGFPMDLVTDHGGRLWWEVLLPGSEPFDYSFALTRDDGRPVYRVPAGIANAVERLDRWRFDPTTARRVAAPAWAQGAVIYQIFPERFRDGDPALTPPGAVPWGSDPTWLDFQGGDLAGIAEKAGYLASLGVDLVYLNPIFRSPSTHRYDAIDYYEVDPTLGGNVALAHLVAELHARDIRLILDASFNHCSPRFFAFADIVANGPDSQYAGWFIVEEYPIRVTVRPHRFEAEGFRHPEQYRTFLARFAEEMGVPVVEDGGDGPAVEPSYEAWYGVPNLPRIDLRHPGPRAYFLEVARHWVREYDIDGWRMDVARYVDFDFWPEFRQAVKTVKPDAYLLAEIMGDASPWLQGDTFDATMNYTFRQLCLDFFATDAVDAGGLAAGLARMYAGYAPEANLVNQNLLSSHDTARFLHEAGNRGDRLALATVFQFTVPGAPGLYYGDEVGMTGEEEPSSRGAFPWHDESLWDRDQLSLVGALGELRRAHPALRTGDFTVLWHGGGAVAYLRSLGAERILVALSRDEAVDMDLPVAADRPRTLFGDVLVEVSGEALRVAGLAAGSAAILAL